MPIARRPSLDALPSPDIKTTTPELSKKLPLPLPQF
jgi:hypothetical protein